MKRFEIVRPIVMSFQTAQEQYETTLDTGVVEWDGQYTLFYVNPTTGRRSESISPAQVLERWLGRGDVEELP